MVAPVLVRGAGQRDGEPTRHPLSISEDDCGGGGGGAGGGGGGSSKTRMDQGVFAIFSRRGERIYAGEWHVQRQPVITRKARHIASRSLPAVLDVTD